MAVVRKALAVGDVEAQVVSLVGGWLFVEMEEDDEGHVALDGDGDLGIGGHRHLQPLAPHGRALVAGEDQPVPTIQDDSGGRDLQVGPLGLVDEDGDGAEVSALFLVAVWGSGGPDQLSVHRHALKAGAGKRAVVRKTTPTFTRGLLIRISLLSCTSRTKNLCSHVGTTQCPLNEGRKERMHEGMSDF